MAISPDRRKLVVVGSNGGRSQLFLRPLDSADAQPLAGTDGAASPFWSPNSRSVGFLADSKLKRMDVPGGAIQVLASATFGLGGTWNQNNVILFAASAASPIYRVSAAGGSAVEVTHLDSPRATTHQLPYFLPGGQHFLFYVRGGEEGVYVGDLESKSVMRLFDSDTGAVYSTLGYLLFIRQNLLFAQRFDTRRRELLGDPFSIVEHAAVDVLFNIGAISAGAGILAYRTGPSSGFRQLAWFDRSGKRLGDLGPSDESALFDPSYRLMAGAWHWTVSPRI